MCKLSFNFEENQKIFQLSDTYWEMTICFIYAGKRIIFENKKPSYQKTRSYVDKTLFFAIKK